MLKEKSFGAYLGDGQNIFQSTFFRCSCFTILFSSILIVGLPREQSLLFIFIALIFSIFLARNFLSQMESAFVLFLSIVCCNFFFYPDKPAYFVYLQWALVGPCAIALAWKQTRFKTLLGVYLFLSILMDLYLGFRHASNLFHVPVPEKILRLDPTLRTPTFALKTEISPWYPAKHFPEQSIRYLSHLYRLPFIFSEALKPLESASLKETLRSGRWNSFLLQKSYVELLGADAHPKQLEEFFGVHSRVQFKTIAASTISEAGGCAVYCPECRASSASNCAGGFHFQVENFAINKIDLKVNAPSDGYLYIADGFHPDWKASINGKSTPIHRANYNFKAIPVTAGESQVQLRFQPLHFVTAVGIFYLMILFAVGVGLLSAIRNSKKAFQMLLSGP